MGDGRHPDNQRRNGTAVHQLSERRQEILQSRSRFVNLNIDLNIHGVGGVDTWGQRTLPEYTIDGNQPYHYAFMLKTTAFP